MGERGVEKERVVVVLSREVVGLMVLGVEGTVVVGTEVVGVEGIVDDRSKLIGGLEGAIWDIMASLGCSKAGLDCCSAETGTT